MHELGINAAVMRGRDAVIPGKNETMCLNRDAVKDAVTVQAPVESSVCGSGKPGEASCPWRTGPNQCGYQRQKSGVAQADVVIATHESLFLPMSKEARSGLAVVIVDEAWWQAGLSQHRELQVASIAQEPVTHPVLDKHGKPNDFATAELHDISRKVQRVLDAAPDKAFVSKADVLEAGLTIRECVQAHALEWRRKVEGVIYPGQTEEDRRKLMRLASGNAAIPRRAEMWKALQALLEGDDTHAGRLQLDTKTTAEGTTRVVVLRTRMDMRPKLAEKPIVYLDATAPLWAVRHFLPRMELLAEVNPPAPHMRIHQVIGGFGKTSLIQHEKAGDAENRRRAGMVRELADFAALNSGGNAAVFTYQAIEAEFQRPGIRTGHFGAIAGLDHFKDVRAAFVIGRPLPDAHELHEATLALTGKSIVATASQVETCGALMADGSGSGVRVRVFADPDMEALRVAITDTAIVQAIGRVRGVTRTADDPVDVFLFADVVVPLPVTRVVRWEDVRPGVLERMASRGVVLFSPTDAARAYPDLFVEGVEAAKKMLQRAELGSRGHLPMNSYLIGKCPVDRWVEVAYRPDAPRMKRRRALVAPERLATLGDWLAELLEVPVQVDPIPNPQPAIEKERAMEAVEAQMPELTTAQADCLEELFRRMAAPWPTKDCDYWTLDTSELTKLERWDLMPLAPPMCQAVSTMAT